MLVKLYCEDIDDNGLAWFDFHLDTYPDTPKDLRYVVMTDSGNFEDGGWYETNLNFTKEEGWLDAYGDFHVKDTINLIMNEII